MVTPQEEGVDVAWQKEMVDKAEPKVKRQQPCFCGETFGKPVLRYSYPRLQVLRPLGSISPRYGAVYVSVPLLTNSHSIGRIDIPVNFFVGAGIPCVPPVSAE